MNQMHWIFREPETLTHRCSCRQILLNEVTSEAVINIQRSY